MKIFRLCKPYLINHKAALISYTLLCLIMNALTISVPYISGNFIDALVSRSDSTVVYRYCVIFAVLNILTIVLGYISSIVYVKMQAKMGYEFNKDLVYHVQDLSLSYIQKTDGVYLNQVINSDTNNLIIFCLTIIQNVVTNVVMLIFPLILIASINKQITLISIIFLIMYVVLYAVFRKRIYNTAMESKVQQGKFFSTLYEQLKNVKFIKVHSIYKEIHEKLDTGFTFLYNSSIRYQKTNYFFSSLDNIIYMLSQIGLYVVGGLQVIIGSLTIGMFTIFSSYFRMMLGAIRYFLNLGKSYQEAAVSFTRLTEIINQPKETIGNDRLNKIDCIEVENLKFSYGQCYAVDTQYLKFEKGKIYGIIGENGSGKSTFINLLLGLYIDETEGDIFYDQISIKNLDMKYIRRNLIGVSEQESTMINDSLSYNLFFNDSEMKQKNTEFLDKCLDIMKMKEYMRKTDGGLDWVINNNSNISGGERLKFSILRVLVKNPDVMIFDEPTSALDASSADSFCEYLKQIYTDKIIIIISHNSKIEEICHHTYDFGSLELNNFSKVSSKIQGEYL